MRCVRIGRYDGTDPPPRPTLLRRETTKGKENGTAEFPTSLLVEQTPHGAFRAGSRPILSSFSRTTYMHPGCCKIAQIYQSLGPRPLGLRFPALLTLPVSRLSHNTECNSL